MSKTDCYHTTQTQKLSKQGTHIHCPLTDRFMMICMPHVFVASFGTCNVLLTPVGEVVSLNRRLNRDVWAGHGVTGVIKLTWYHLDWFYTWIICLSRRDHVRSPVERIRDTGQHALCITYDKLRCDNYKGNPVRKLLIQIYDYSNVY